MRRPLLAAITPMAGALRDGRGRTVAELGPARGQGKGNKLGGDSGLNFLGASRKSAGVAPESGSKSGLVARSQDLEMVAWGGSSLGALGEKTLPTAFGPAWGPCTLSSDRCLDLDLGLVYSTPVVCVFVFMLFQRQNAMSENNTLQGSNHIAAWQPHMAPMATLGQAVVEDRASTSGGTENLGLNRQPLRVGNCRATEDAWGAEAQEREATHHTHTHTSHVAQRPHQSGHWLVPTAKGLSPSICSEVLPPVPGA